MNPHWNAHLNKTLSRRDLLQVSSAGFGSLALAGLLGALACFLAARTAGPERMTVPYQVWHHGEDGSPLISAAAYGGEPALVDTLSGLLTGRYFQASLENRIAAARRHLRPVSIVLVEIFDGRDRKSQQRSDAGYVGDIIRKTMREADIA